MTNSRDIYIGDIHGCFHELMELMKSVELTPEDRLISVGDLVDRGPNSLEVWELLRSRPNTIALMGNHERKHVRGVLSYSQEIVKLQFAERYPEFCDWAAELPYFFETEHAIAVHGGFENGRPLSEQREDVLAATTAGEKHLGKCYSDSYWPEHYTGTKPIVFGHHVVGDEAEVWGERVYGLDTGACHGGFLTALIVPGFTLHGVAAASDHWAREGDKWRLPVLRNRPWSDYKFSKLTREIEGLQKGKSSIDRSFATELQDWLRQVETTLPAIVERARAAATEIGAGLEGKERKKRLAAEPFSGLLFASDAGSLDPESIKTTLPNIARLQAAAEHYGLSFPRRVS